MLHNSLDKSIEIKVIKPEMSAVINANPTQIEQVLLNICINAAHSMTIMRKEDEVWGGTLSISLEKMVSDDKFLKIYQNAKEGEYWCLSVEDSGVGIKDTTKVFTREFSTQNSTGLGLDIVKRLCDSMGIEISVTSNDSGSCFKLTFT
jgi:signal transduction histidine kinase